MIRPLAPVPATLEISKFFSRASRRTAGDTLGDSLACSVDTAADSSSDPPPPVGPTGFPSLIRNPVVLIES